MKQKQVKTPVVLSDNKYFYFEVVLRIGFFINILGFKGSDSLAFYSVVVSLHAQEETSQTGLYFPDHPFTGSPITHYAKKYFSI
jgi:hypothetical protein